MTILDLLDTTTFVNDVAIGFILAFFGIIGGIIVGIVVFKYKWKKAEENKQREKLEQERDKRREELQNNIHEHNEKLILEIKDWIRNGSASVYYEPLVKKHLEEYGEISKLYHEFDKGFRDIISDFEERHIELKGTCKDCKDWHEELESHK